MSERTHAARKGHIRSASLSTAADFTRYLKSALGQSRTSLVPGVYSRTSALPNATDLTWAQTLWPFAKPNSCRDFWGTRARRRAPAPSSPKAMAARTSYASSAFVATI